MNTFVTAISFVAVSSLVAGLVLFCQDLLRRKPHDRLRDLARGTRSGGQQTPLSDIVRAAPNANRGRLGRWLLRRASAARWFEQAGLQPSLDLFLVLSVVFGAAGMAAVSRFAAPPLAGPLAALAGAALPWLWVAHRRRRRLARFAAQLPSALDLLARSLRSGNSLAVGIRTISEEMLPPLSLEFGRVAERNHLGEAMEDALKDMCDRVPNEDLRFFVTSVNMQRQTGGDLAEILDKISYIVRERFRVMGQVHALTGEGRISGSVLMVMPLVVVLFMYLTNREYTMLLFTDPLGKKMVGMAVCLQVVGAIAIRKIVQIKV